MTEIETRPAAEGSSRKSNSRPSGTWKPGLFEKAVDLAGEGKSARQIADALGNGITRSAVICKFRRNDIEFMTAPSGGRGIPRRGISKGSGKNAQNRPQVQREDSGRTGTSTPDFEASELSAIAVSMDGGGSHGRLGLRRERLVVVATQPTEWEDDRIEMARQLIEIKKLSPAQAAQHMGVGTAEMNQICRIHNLQITRTPRIKVAKPIAPAAMKISRETPSPFDLPASLGETVRGMFDQSIQDEPTREPVSLFDLTMSDCRYIVGEDKSGLATYCGCRVIHGKSWCHKHASVVFTTASR